MTPCPNQQTRIQLGPLALSSVQHRHATVELDHILEKALTHAEMQLLDGRPSRVISKIPRYIVSSNINFEDRYIMRKIQDVIARCKTDPAACAAGSCFFLGSGLVLTDTASAHISAFFTQTILSLDDILRAIISSSFSLRQSYGNHPTLSSSFLSTSRLSVKADTHL